MSEEANTPTEAEQRTDSELPSFEELGFTEESVGNSMPEAGFGEPEPTDATDTSAVEDTPPGDASDKESVDTEAPDENASTEAPDAAASVSFDGFSDSQKATWERLLEGGHVTAEEVEEERRSVLRQADYTRKTMALAEKAKKVEEDKANLAILRQIQSDERYLDRWDQLTTEITSGAAEGPESELDDEIVDGRSAREIAAAEFKRLRAAEIAAAEAETTARVTKEQRLLAAAEETMIALGVDAETMNAYMAAERDKLPSGVDPVEYLTPAEVRSRLTARHELSVSQARIKKLEQLVQDNASQSEQASRQSMPPARSISQGGVKTPHEQVLQDIPGLRSDWSNVEGMGWNE